MAGSMSEQRRRAWRGAIAAALVSAPLAAGAEPSVEIVPLGFEVAEFRGPASRFAAVLATSEAGRGAKPGQPLVAVWGKAGAAAITLEGGRLRIVPVEGAAARDLAGIETPRGALPSSRLQSAGPLTVYLSEPSRDHAHGALGGEGVEAASLTISERQPVQPGPDPKPVPVKVARIPAGPDAVFEDREPRLVELGRDGPSILAVKSHRERGSSLAIIGRREGEWRIVAETPPTGEPNRWLNPAAVADFDRDGRAEIALVRTPHRDGLLQVWSFDAGRLTLKHEAPGYSNHAFGSAAIDLAATFDLDGDGAPELAIPALDRKSLALLSLKGGITELRRIPLPARAATGVAALGQGRETHILVGLEDGRVADVRP